MRDKPWIFFVLGLGLWLGLIGRAGLADFLLGIPVIASAWWLFCRVLDPPQDLSSPRLWSVCRFMIGYVAPEMLRSTYRVSRKVLDRTPAFSPAIVAVAVPEASRGALILLAYGISLAPGQQIVDIDEPAGILYVHAMDAPDPEIVRSQILAVYRHYLLEDKP